VTAPRHSRTKLAPAVEGILWMVLAAVCWTLNTIIIRPITAEIPAPELLFWRSLFSSLLMLPFLMHVGFGVLRTTRLPLYGLRALAMLISMLLWIWAVKYLHVADAVALSFTSPLFATILAVTLLHEKVGVRRWTAVAIGFAGALIIIRPGSGLFDPAAFFALGNSASWALAIILIRMLSRTDSSTVIVTYMFLMLTPLSLIPSLFVWVWPSVEAFALLFALASTGLIGHLAATRAFAVAETATVAPVEYLQLPLVAVSGFFLFGEVPHIYMPVGAAIVIGSVIYISRREAVRARAAAKEPLPPEPKPS
jgi:drug/metabolite transporter (DMT)-like permease